MQTAICCYLDYTLPAKLPSMSLKAAQNQETAVGPGAWYVELTLVLCSYNICIGCMHQVLYSKYNVTNLEFN